jgi:hypothetical protein
MKRPALLLAALVLALAACAGGVSQPPSATPAGIEHPKGPTDVVLRFEEGGGFVPIDFLAGNGPIFTLYGDGTVIFRDLNGPQPDAAGGVSLMLRYQIAHLSEEQVQSFLAFALGAGGLGLAHGHYSPGNVADMPVATFTVNADGVTKEVSVEALGMDNPQSPDLAILRQLATLGERLRSFTSTAPGAVPWSPDRYRGVLTAAGGGPARAWPWPELSAADFRPLTLPSGREWNARTMTPDEAAALGVPGFEAGVSFLPLAAPDGTTWSFTLRPLLPDEPA